MDKKEQDRIRAKRYRDARRDVSVTQGVKNVTQDTGIVTLLKRPNGADYNPGEVLPDGRLRYLGPLSDGQVLDKTTIPIVGKSTIPHRRLQELRAVVNATFTPCTGRDPKRLRVELQRHLAVEQVAA